MKLDKILAIYLIFFCNSVFAFDFLKLGADAKSAGMGNTGTSTVRDATAVYWNYARLGTIKTKNIVLSYVPLYEGMIYNYLAFVLPVTNEDRGLGIDLAYFNAGRITSYDSGSFEVSDSAVSIAYGQKLGDNIYAGTNIKYIYQKIGDFNANTFSLSCAGLYRYKRIVVGGTIQNVVSSAIKYLVETESLPITIKIGGGYYLKKNLTVAVDTTFSEGKTDVSIGSEYNIKSIAIRAGYDINYTRITVGVGFEKERYRIDYAYVPYKDLGDTHWFTLRIFFIEPEKDVITN